MNIITVDETYIKIKGEWKYLYSSVYTNNMYNLEDFNHKYELPLMSGFTFPWMHVLVRTQLVTIRDAPIENFFKAKWIEVIASLFDENNIYDKKSLESKMIDAEKKLSTALTFADGNDIEKIDADWINKEILQQFEAYLKSKMKFLQLC